MAMPKNFYGSQGETHGDREWISERIGLLPIAYQSDVADRYNYIYTKMVSEGDKEARSRANTWLRLTVDKHKVVQVNDGSYF